MLNNNGNSNDTLEQTAKEISERILQLETLIGEDLKNEMAALKVAILENPSASALLLPSDIGALVSALRKITGTAIASASAKKKEPKEPKEKAKKMTAAEIAAALDSEDF